MIRCQEDAVALAKEANLPIRVSRCPDHAVIFTDQVDIFIIFNQRKCFMWWYANKGAHDLRIHLRKPEIGGRQAVLPEKLRDLLEAPGHVTRPVDLHTSFIDRVHIDRRISLFIQLC